MNRPIDIVTLRQKMNLIMKFRTGSNPLLLIGLSFKNAYVIIPLNIQLALP